MSGEERLKAMRREFNIDELVILDEGFANSSKVTVVEQTPGFLYTTVRDEDNNEWTVMTYRLKPIPYGITNKESNS